MIEPKEADILAVEAQYGPLAVNATVDERAERQRLYQAQALIASFTPPATAAAATRKSAIAVPPRRV